MRVTDLFEMPIQNLTLVGDFDKAHSFKHQQDRKILSSPKGQQKIIHKWKNTVVDFNMYFVNMPGAGKHIEVGEVNMEWLNANLPKVVPQLDIKDDAVNVIFTNNNGDERFPMTAWVIAHRLGHAIQASTRPWRGGTSTQNVTYFFNEARSTLLSYCADILAHFGKDMPRSERDLTSYRWGGDGISRNRALLRHSFTQLAL
jgi:hypothetical protein